MERGRYPRSALFIIGISTLSLVQNASDRHWGLVVGDLGIGLVGIAVLWQRRPRRPRPTIDQLMRAGLRPVPKEAPVDRADALLCRHLSPSQLAEFRRLNRFTVRGSDGRQYHIRSALHHNVSCDRIIYCAAPVPWLGLPMADQLLAQKLLIETNAEHFRRVAYATPVYIYHH